MVVMGDVDLDAVRNSTLKQFHIWRALRVGGDMHHLVPIYGNKLI